MSNVAQKLMATMRTMDLSQVNRGSVPTKVAHWTWFGGRLGSEDIAISPLSWLDHFLISFQPPCVAPCHGDRA